MKVNENENKLLESSFSFSEYCCFADGVNPTCSVEAVFKVICDDA